MALSFVQSDTASPCGTVTACSGLTVQNAIGRLAVEGGAAGSSAVTSTPRSLKASVMFELSPSLEEWDPGTWTIPLNITTANALATLEEVHVCRVNSACTSIGSVGSTTSIGTALSSTGVQSVNVTGVRSVGSADDKVYVVIGFDTDGSPQALGWTPDQTIITPLSIDSDAESDTRNRIFTSSLEVNNMGRSNV